MFSDWPQFFDVSQHPEFARKGILIVIAPSSRDTKMSRRILELSLEKYASKRSDYVRVIYSHEVSMTNPLNPKDKRNLESGINKMKRLGIVDTLIVAGSEPTLMVKLLMKQARESGLQIWDFSKQYFDDHYSEPTTSNCHLCHDIDELVNEGFVLIPAGAFC